MEAAGSIYRGAAAAGRRLVAAGAEPQVWGMHRNHRANGADTAVSSKAAVAFGETAIWTIQKRGGTKKTERSSTEPAGEQLSLF
jgi:hypothetical protein